MEMRRFAVLAAACLLIVVFASGVDASRIGTPSRHIGAETECFSPRGIPLERVIADCTGILLSNPVWEIRLRALQTRGWAYASIGKHARAIEDYDRVLRVKRDDPHTLTSRGQAYSAIGEYAHAIEDYDHVLRMKPNDRYALSSRCWARAIWGQQLDLALADCNQSLKKRPKSAETLDSRALLYFRLNEFTAAITNCNAALAVNPKLPSCLYVRGLAKMKSSDAAGAEADIAAAKAMEPKIAETYSGYGVKP